jgi:NAD(P)-dependent dehydrogenase (short-subunit alcohol dehydrogenase family)
VVDLASLVSVRGFARDFAAHALPPLAAVVCNAGVHVVSGTTVTSDGFETTFAVNHLGHFLLVNLLLPQLARPARIVFVSSGTHDPRQRTGMPSPRCDDPERLARPPQDGMSTGDAGAIGRQRYATSKLCNVLCAYELSRRLRANGTSTDSAPITVNAFDPGLMPGTGLARDYGTLSRIAWRFVLPALRPLAPGVSTPERSGRALARLVLDPHLEAVSGRYYRGREEARSSDESYDLRMAERLWDGSAALVGLDAWR